MARFQVKMREIHDILLCKWQVRQSTYPTAKPLSSTPSPPDLPATTTGFTLRAAMEPARELLEVF